MPFVNHAAFEEGQRSQQITTYKLYPHQSTEQEDYQVLSENMPSLFEDDLHMIQNREEIPFWVEEKGEAWTKINKLLVNTPQLLFALTGHHSAESGSSGANTFEFFDDFEGDLSKWIERPDYSGGASIVSNPDGSGNVLKTNGSGLPYGNEMIKPDYSFSKPYIVEYLFRTNDNSDPGLLGILDDWYGAGSYRIVVDPGYPTSAKWGYRINGGSWTDTGHSLSVDTWYKMEWERSATHLDVIEDSTNILSTDNSDSHGIFLFQSGSIFHVDNFFVRKYISPEPIILKRRTKGKSDTIRAIVAGISA